MCDNLDEEGLQLVSHLCGLVLLHSHEQTQAKQLAVPGQNGMLHTIHIDQLEGGGGEGGRRGMEGY